MDINIQPDYDAGTDEYPVPVVSYTDFPSQGISGSKPWTLCTITLGTHTIKLFLPLGARL